MSYKDKEKQRSCGQCTFWHHVPLYSSPATKNGECRFKAPEPMRDQHSQFSGIWKESGEYPLTGLQPTTVVFTQENYWCGEFRARFIPKED